MRLPLSPSSPAAKAIAMLLLATLLYAVQDAMIKHLTQTLAPVQIVAVRFLTFTVFALLYIAHRAGIAGIIAAARANRPALQVLRGLLLCSESIVFAYAITFLGLAEMHAVVACFPLIVTALSVPLLREQVGWRRWTAVGIGFIGTLIILRPGGGVFQPAAFIALASAFLFALYNILTRHVSKHDSVDTSLLYFGAVVGLSAGAVAPFYWRPVSADAAFWLAAVSIVTIGSHGLLIKALSLAPAALLQPFNYFVLPWALLIAFLVFGEVLSAATLAGTALVVAGGVFVAWREYRVK